MTKATPYHSERMALLNEKTKLEDQIIGCQDIEAIKLLRADYRAVCDKLELFYDDEREVAE